MRKVLTPTWTVWVRAIVHNSTVKNLNSLESLPKSRNRDHFLTHNSFYENHHYTKPKSDKDITRQENYRPISLMDSQTSFRKCYKFNETMYKSIYTL